MNGECGDGFKGDVNEGIEEDKRDLRREDVWRGDGGKGNSRTGNCGKYRRRECRTGGL